MRTIAILAAAAAAAGAAHALEPFRSYDNFGSTPLDAKRWVDGERVRQIRGGALNLMQRTYGATASDSGLTFVNFNENMASPGAVTALKAKVTVNSVETATCASNPGAVGQSRARIIGSLFNSATPTPGSQIDDVIAQVRITRFSNSADPAGTLRVQGLVNHCTSADCNAAVTIGNVVDLGTTTLGQPVVVQWQWDQGSKTVFFSRDGGAASGAVAYTESDLSPPSLAFKQASTRLDLPNCMTAGASVGAVDAAFDNVQVNKSAAP